MTRSEVTYKRITCAELDQGDYSVEYLIKGIYVARQPKIICGPKKALKTSVAVDFAISLATGGHFLGLFKVTRPSRTAIMSGESGLGTLQETARRVAAAAGKHLADIDGLIWSDDLPKFGHLLHMDALRKFLLADEIETLIVDPLYLVMPGADAGNLFIQGELLRAMGKVCTDCNCGLVILHHDRKNVADKFGPPDMDNIGWAGIGEWMRQWLLLGRRAAYKPGTGHHELWMSVGGSAGHSGLWGLDVDEGEYHEDVPRRWEVAIRFASELESVKVDAKQQAREQKQAAKLDQDRRSLCNAMAKFPEGETPSVLKPIAGLSGERFPYVLASLLESGEVVRVELMKGTRKTPYEGFKLKTE